MYLHPVKEMAISLCEFTLKLLISCILIISTSKEINSYLWIVVDLHVKLLSKQSIMHSIIEGALDFLSALYSQCYSIIMLSNAIP